MEIKSQEIDCPHGGPDICGSDCAFCGGVGILVITPKQTVCALCQNMGNVIASPNGYVGAACPSCGVSPTPEQLRDAIAALIAANAQGDNAVPVYSTPIDKGNLAKLLEPTVKPAYWKS